MSFGDSNTSSDSSSKQSTTTDPWAAAIPQLKNILSTLGQQPTTPNSTTTGAINQLITNAQGGDPNAAGVNGAVASQLGADTTGEQKQVSDANTAYANQNQSVANGDNQNILANPQIQALMQSIQSDTTNSVNGQFAGAGRSGSGANVNALSRGIASGEAPALLSELNTQQARSDAASSGINNSAVNAATTNAGLKGAQATIQNSGIANDPAALAASNWGPTQIAQLGETLQNLPLDQISQIANILFPAAQLGGTSTGTKTGSSDSNTTSFGFKL